MTYEESLACLDEKWHMISDEQKIEVLQAIENKMAYDSGRMPCMVEGRFMHTGNDGIVLGSYNDSDKRIYINTSQFDSESLYGRDSSRLVETTIHEGRHAMQHQVANGEIEFDNKILADIWKYNLQPENYISFKNNPRAYYNQPVEIDARNFASRMLKQVEQDKLNYNNLNKETDNIEYQNSSRNIFERQMNRSFDAANYMSNNEHNSQSIRM